MICDFFLMDVYFKMLDLVVEFDDFKFNLRVLGMIWVIVGFLVEMNFFFNVINVWVNVDVFYKKDKFGELNFKEW